MANKNAIVQPPFDSRIKTMSFPLEGRKHGGILKRGFMVWDKPIAGFSDKAQLNFLYNPATVDASYSMSTPGVGASLLFPNANDTADLRVPLNQSVSWTILYDRTYELWGQYYDNGNPKQARGPDNNNPSVVGVLADIYQMEQFTGMTVSYTPQGHLSHTLSQTSLTGRQGILQLIPSFVYFGDVQNLAYYGYITAWDCQITHWTQHMVPMRCVIDISMTMLPPPGNTTTTTGGPIPGRLHGPGGGGPRPPTVGASQNVVAPVVVSNTGRSGR